MISELITIIPEKLHAQKNYSGINFQKCVMTFRVINYMKLVRPQAGGVCARNRLHKIIPDGLIPNRVIDYTP